MASLAIAFALLLILEGIGPMLFPNRWQRYLKSLADLPGSQLQQIGGVMVLIGGIWLWSLLT